MHFFSVVILGFTANELLCSLTVKPIHPMITAFFIIGFACMSGVIWEIFEFTVDNLLNLDTQMVAMTGVYDTMEDLITDLLGGILVAIYYAFPSKKHQF